MSSTYKLTQAGSLFNTRTNKYSASTFAWTFFLLFTLLSYSSLKSQSGSNDATFNPTDLGLNNGDGFNNTVNVVSIQPDGKILVGGSFTIYNGISRARIARLNSDFTNDVSFSTATFPNNTVNSITQQPDGKIILSGSFTTYGATSSNRIVRLSSTGILDASFAIGTGANNVINSTALQADGKVIIGGTFTAFNGTSINRIARLNSDGSLDTSFHVGTGINGTVSALVIQPDGKIIVGGAFTAYNGATANRITRLNTDGSKDIGFTPGTAASNNINSIKLQADGQILVGGNFTTYNGTARARIARLNTNGSLEIGFNPGTGANNIIYTIDVQSDGKILIGGNFTTVNGNASARIARLNSSGSFDASLVVGTAADAAINSCFVQSDGMIVLGGSFTSYNAASCYRACRISSTGSLESIFSGSGSNDIINSSALQSDGKILIGGSFLSYNTVMRARIARVNSDGSLDASFNPGAGSSGIVYSLSVQSDGKIIAGGAFSTISGTARNRIARLTTTGGIDATFAPGTGANNTVYSTVIQPDGNILIGGLFTTYNGTSINRLARLTTTGALDPSFNVGTGANNTVYSTVIQPDGKIIVGGSFTSFNGTACNRIVRLNSDGSVDATFNIGAGFSTTVFSILIQPDGKILAGGQFATYNGTTSKGIVRINSNGSIDNTFSISSNLGNSTVNTLCLQSDGKIFIGGNFASYGVTLCSRIARLNSNGTLDASVNTTAGANKPVNTMLLQPDGKVIIGGQFTSYDGTGRNRLARVNILSGINIIATAAANGSISPAGTTNFVSGNNQTYTISPISGYCINDVLVDGVSVGNVPNYTFSNITTSHTIDASFTPQLIPALSISSGYVNDMICSGSAVTFTATPTNGGPSPTYQWQLNGSNIATGATYNNNSLTAGDIVSCVLTSNNTCQSTATAMSNTITISVTSSVNTAQTLSICSGQSLSVGIHSYSTSGTYKDTLVSSGGCDSIITTNLTVLSQNTASQSVSVCFGQSYSINSHTYSSSGTYLDTLVSSLGCDSILTTNLTVNSAINISTSNLTIDTISALNSFATSYQWLDCGNGFTPLSGETNQHFGVTVNGSYAVIVSEGACSDTSSCVNVNLVGLAKNTSDASSLIRIYPNPNAGIFILEVQDAAHITICNLTGAAIYSSKVIPGKTEINLKNYDSGLYFIIAKDKEGNLYHERFIIEK